MRSPQGEDGAREWTGGRLWCAPVGEVTRKWTSWGPKAAVGDGSPTAGVWGCSLGRPGPTARAVALLRVDPTRSRGAVLEQPTKGKEREVGRGG